MIAVNDHSPGFFPEDCLFGNLRRSEKPRLQSTKLYHHTQQRRDDLFAREDQHRPHHLPPSEKKTNLVGNLRTYGGSLADRWTRLDIVGTDVHPLRHQSEGR